MTVKINTKDGQIELSDDVIATVVGGSATEIFGVVGMASKSAIRDNFQALLGKENYAKGVVVKSTDAGITVDVYTVMSYGVKISEVSKNIQTECRNLGVSKMGSTVAAVVLNGLQASIFWAGDSRVYVFRDKHLLYQTEDHSLLNELSRVRELSFDEKKRYKHIITRSIMGNADDKVDHDNLELCFGDEILICTDGMYNEYPIDYLIESIRMDKLDIEKKNDSFTDNHSFIYILL